MILLLLPLLFTAGMQLDPDTTSAGARQETERFLKAYLAVNSLEPTPEELAPLRARFAQGSPDGSQSSRKISDQFAWSLAANYKFQRDVFRKHGGRVVLSAFGFHVAKDAMAAEWLAWEKAGRWRFPDLKVREDVFRALSETKGDGVVTGDRAREIFARPIWDLSRQ